MATRETLSGPITLSAALARDKNILHDLDYPQHKRDFYALIESYRPLLPAIVAHHVNAAPEDVTISPQEYWRHGSFNLCVAVHVDNTSRPSVPQQIMLRFPLPHRVGEATNPGNADEKLNCEAATYAWLQDNCPSIRVPALYGLGLSSQQRYTNIDSLSWHLCWVRRLQRFFLPLLGLEVPSKYVRHESDRLAKLSVGYLIIELIPDYEAEMLSEYWDEQRDDARMANLQRDLAEIMVTLAKVPLPRIGAFRLDNKGYLHLDNRPLSIKWSMQENEGITVGLGRQKTFSSVQDFVTQHIIAFDNRLLYQPNAIRGSVDAWRQMTSLTVARTIFPQMFRSSLDHGPFVLTLSDLHRSNIMVDKDWNIVCIIDLEFTCSWPIEFTQTPYWLGGKFIDTLEKSTFEPKHAEFLEYIEKAEHQHGIGQLPLSQVMRQAWTDGSFWCILAIMDPIAFANIFYGRILPYYFSMPEEESDNAIDAFRYLAQLWRPGAQAIVEQKKADRKDYLQKLESAFANDK